jgi:hypothetical protein
MSMYRICHTEAEIDAVRNAALDQMDKGGSAYPGMSYEEGVAVALDWAIDPGMDTEAPLP